MKLRFAFTALLAAVLAAPVIATVSRFPDVPTDHRHAEAIEWASDPENFNGSPLFKGFPDGRFGPDEELTEGQFSKVVERLFDTADRWTRAETAALLYRGLPALRADAQPGTDATTTTTITTTMAIQPVVEFVRTEFIRPTEFYLVLRTNRDITVEVAACGRQTMALEEGINKVSVDCPSYIGEAGVSVSAGDVTFFTRSVDVPSRATTTVVTTTTLAPFPIEERLEALDGRTPDRR